MILTKSQQSSWMDKMPDSTDIHDIENDGVAITSGVSSLDSFPVSDSRVQLPVEHMIAYGKNVGEEINWLWIHKNFQPNV